MKSDPEFNIEFVSLVQKHPCIYDHTMADYRNSTIQEKAWLAVANTLCETVHDCKERWKNLRGCFTRHLKSSQSSNLKKPYYLAEYLTFLLPFTTTRGKHSWSQSFTTTLDIDDDDDSLNVSEHDDKLRSSQSPLFSSCNDADESSSKKQKIEEEDADLMFMRSLLPDMKEMTGRQKRKFKIGVLNMVINILEEGGSSSSPSSDTQCKITSSGLVQPGQHTDPLKLEKVEVKYCIE